MRPKVHLLDGIDRNNALENSLCLTESIGEKIITRMNLQISTRKIYCKTSNYKGLRFRKALDTVGRKKCEKKFHLRISNRF